MKVLVCGSRNCSSEMERKVKEVENDFTFQEVESLEWMELSELQDKINDGYPEIEEIERYNLLVKNLDPDRELLLHKIEQENPSEDFQTNAYHADRRDDDRLSQLEYDGIEKDEPYFALGKSISFSTPNFKCIRSPSPFNGKAEYNAAIYRYCHQSVDSRNWIKISGFTQKCLRNHLQVWLEIPEFMKENGIPTLAKHLTCFVFGEIVNEYREKVISLYPQHFKRTKCVETHK